MSEMTMKIIKIDGMTCRSCEKVIETALSKLDGVVKVKASFQNATVMIKWDSSKLKLKDIIQVIEKSGYEVAIDNSNRLVIITFAILFGLYLIFREASFFNYVPEVDDNMGYGLLFIVGMFTSIHCIAMCGGINIAVNMSNSDHKYRSSLLYNMGRVISYTIIGGIVGGIGSAITFSSTAKDIVSILAGLFMIGLGIGMTGLLRRRGSLNILPKSLIGLINKIKGKTKSPFIIGLLNGLMPCGPLQTMQLYALGTGSIIKGALSMFVFSLGTVPLMLGLGSLSAILSGRMGVKLKKLSGVLVVLLGIIMFNRGFDYSIFNRQASPVVDPSKVTTSVIKGDYQEVTTRFENGRYQSIAVQKGIPVKWIIVIEDGDLNSCNNAIEISEYEITKDLNYGENIVEFTPDKVGIYKYTCWMHMMRNVIYVVDDIASIK